MADDNTSGAGTELSTPEASVDAGPPAITLTPGEEGSGDGPRSTTQTLKDGAGKLGEQATDRLRAFADDGKTRATDALDELAKLIEGAAGNVEGALGGQVGGYARSAAGAVTGFADQVRNKDVDALMEDVTGFVRKSPGIAIGVAAALGFVAARVLKSGLDAGRDRA